MPDKDRAVAAVQSALGIEAPKPTWSHGGEGRGFRVTFCRANRSLAHAPTLIELIEPAALDPERPLTEVLPNVQGLADLQGARPLKTHGAPIASSEVDALVDRVRRLGVRHWVQPASDWYPYSRLWIGIDAQDLAGYRPDGDGGLMLEVVDTATLRLPDDAFTGPPPPPAARAAGTMVRVLSRGFLVSDLDHALGCVARTLGWEPEDRVERATDGSRRARLGFRLAQSARLELIEPRGDREERDFLERSGPGIWHVRVGVLGLDAKADDLRARGTPYRVVRTGFADPEVVLRVDASAVPGCLFEFAEAASSATLAAVHIEDSGVLRGALRTQRARTTRHLLHRSHDLALGLLSEAVEQ